MADGASSTSIEEFRQLVERLTSLGGVCSNDDLNVALRLATAIMKVLQDRADLIVNSNTERPVMSCFMSDGWSVRLSDFTTVTAGGQTTRREGRYRHEFLLERGIVRGRRPGAQAEMAMLMAPPRALRCGRSSWHMFVAGCEFRAPLRAQGHTGIAISVYLMDGAMFDATFAKFQALHKLWYDEAHGGCMSNDSRFLRQSEWVVGFRCKIHAAHLAVQWGLQHLAGPEVVDNTHISIASLLNCSAALHDRVSVFMRRFLVFEPRGPLPQGAVSEFWERLDVPPALLSLFVAADPLWDESRQLLVVDASLQSDEECWE